MEANPAARAAAGGGWDRDVDRAGDGLEELPEHRGGGVAEDGAGATGEDGGHEAAVEAETSVTHGVNAVVDAMEPTMLDPPRDRALVETNGVKLRNGDNPMLLRRNPRHLSVGGVTFLSHSESKATGLETLPPTPLFFALFGALGTARPPW